MNVLFRRILALMCCTFATAALHSQQAAAPLASPAVTSTAVTTTGGTIGTLPYFNGSSTLLPSSLYFSSTGLGIGKAPTAALDVNGSAIARGNLQLSRSGDATASAGFNSYPLSFQVSVYNSSSKTIATPVFQLQAEPKGNNTASTAGTFNFLYASKETGLYFNSNGTIHFAPAQTFPITQGPQGPAGPEGPAGPSGPTGPAGPAGMNTLQLFTATTLLQIFSDNVDQYGSVMGVSYGLNASDYYAQAKSSLIFQKACRASNFKVNLGYESLSSPFVLTSSLAVSGTNTALSCDSGFANGIGFTCSSSGTYAIPAGAQVSLDFSHTGTNPANVYPQVTFQCE